MLPTDRLFAALLDTLSPAEKVALRDMLDRQLTDRERDPGLTFRQLRAADVARLPSFKGCDTWDAADWMVAACGELGEAANVLKKHRRGDFQYAEAKSMLADELADTVTYIDLLAHYCFIDLGEAVRSKFNVVSERRRSEVRL